MSDDRESSELGRREVLKSGAALSGLAATAGMPFLSKLALAQGETLVPFTDVPEDYAVAPKVEGAVHFVDTRHIDSFYTPNDEFYLVQHYGQPEVSMDDYTLRITGLVDQTLEITLDELKGMEKVEVDAGFECGGNRHDFYHGLIGNAKWGGVRLKDLLERAGVQDDGIEVVFYAMDKGMETIRNTEVEQSFGRSMRIDDAMRDEVLVTYEMNGDPLPGYHGAPVRLIVPGWYGVANVKWLNHIHVQDKRYMGRFMARDYVTLRKVNVGGVERWDEISVTWIQLKSSIVRVTERNGSHRVTGFVLNDGTPLESIEIKIDDGPWQKAEIDPDSSQYSWKLFYLDWDDATPGEHTMVSRVTDINGQVQATADEMPEKVTRWENYAQFPRTVMIS